LPILTNLKTFYNPGMGMKNVMHVNNFNIISRSFQCLYNKRQDEVLKFQ
jgi:hypothetical protein